MSRPPKQLASGTMLGSPMSPLSPPVVPSSSTSLPPSRGQTFQMQCKSKSLTGGKSKSLCEILMDDGNEEILISDIEMSSSSDRETKDSVTVNCRLAGFRKELVDNPIPVRASQGSRLQDLWFEACAEPGSALRNIGYKKLTKEVDVCNQRAKTREVFHIEDFVRDLPAGANHLMFVLEENQRTREFIVRGDAPTCSSTPLPKGYGILSGARSRNLDEVHGQHSHKSASLSRGSAASPKSASFSADTNFSLSRPRPGKEKRRNFARLAPWHLHRGIGERVAERDFCHRFEDDFPVEQPRRRDFSPQIQNMNLCDSPYARNHPGLAQGLPHNCGDSVRGLHDELVEDPIQDRVPAFFPEDDHAFLHPATLPMPIPIAEDDLRMQNAYGPWQASNSLSQRGWSFEDHGPRIPHF